MDFFDGTALSGFEAMIWLPALALGVALWHVGHKIRRLSCRCFEPYRLRSRGQALRQARSRKRLAYDSYAPFDEGDAE